MTNQWAVFESHVHLYKPQANTTRVDEFLIDCIKFWYRFVITQLYSFTFDTDLSYCFISQVG